MLLLLLWGENVKKRITDSDNEINSIRSKSNANQWRNTQSGINWFFNIKDKDKHSFLVFDIPDFYPSISEALRKLLLEYARLHTTLSNKDIKIIMLSRTVNRGSKKGEFSKVWCCDGMLWQYPSLWTCGSLHPAQANIHLHQGRHWPVQQWWPRRV